MLPLTRENSIFSFFQIFPRQRERLRTVTRFFAFLTPPCNFHSHFSLPAPSPIHLIVRQHVDVFPHLLEQTIPKQKNRTGFREGSHTCPLSKSRVREHY